MRPLTLLWMAALAALVLSACSAAPAADPPAVQTAEAPAPIVAQTATTAPTAIPTLTAVPTAAATAPAVPPTLLPTAGPPADPNAGIVFAEAGDPSAVQVAITIDDFLYSDVIEYWLIDFVRENPDVKLTLFPVGNRIQPIEDQFPGIWREWLAAGHEIGFHSLNHDQMDSMTAEQIEAEIVEFNRLVGEAVGDPDFRVRWARATYGDYGGDRAKFAGIAQEFGLTWVRWSIIPSHRTYVGHIYGMQTPDAIRSGDIALFHVRWIDQYWIEKYVEECRRRGVQMVTLSQMQLVGDGWSISAP